MSEPIAAIATPPVPSAIGIVRVSGEGAIEAASAVFRAASGRPLAACESRRLVYGTLLGPDGAPIDQVLATLSRAPHSYTGEDTAELQCHGSPAVLAMALEALFAQGVRQAGPGEFTKRAFLNGKLDLTQAEAVADLLEAETPAAVRQAAGQLSGALSRRVAALYDGLVDLMAHFHAVLDYPDEDIEDIRPDEIRRALRDCDATLTRLLDTCGRGNVLKNGVATAIVGRPNAGKSSLLNALAGYERAIDTAGIRDTEDAVEKLGVERSRQALERADLALAVVDGSAAPTEEDGEILRLASRCPRWILVLNKQDLHPGRSTIFSPDPSLPKPDAAVEVSALNGDVFSLERAVERLFPEGDVPDGSILTNARQQEAAQRAREAVRRALEALESGLTPDAVLTDAEEALDALGELTGRTAREEIVQQIFSRFCVGK